MLVLEGSFTRCDRFVYMPLGADAGMVKVWQAVVLALFLKKGFIDQSRCDMLNSWQHCGFSVESETRLFTKTDGEALGQYVARGATSAEKISYHEASDTVVWSAYPEGYFKD